jgi:hypothetical protein
MAKYNKKIVNYICSIIEKDSYTIPEICKMVGIDEATYHRWKIDKPEFCEAIEKARDKFIKNGLVECEKSLMKLIIGYEYEESKTVVVNDGSNNPKIKEKSTTKKHVSPNLGAVIHFQTNKDPDNWKNKQSTELTGKDGKDLMNSIDLSKLSDEELKQYHLLLTKASAKE